MGSGPAACALAGTVCARLPRQVFKRALFIKRRQHRKADGTFESFRSFFDKEEHLLEQCQKLSFETLEAQVGARRAHVHMCHTVPRHATPCPNMPSTHHPPPFQVLMKSFLAQSKAKFAAAVNSVRWKNKASRSVENSRSGRPQEQNAGRLSEETQTAMSAAATTPRSSIACVAPRGT